HVERGHVGEVDHQVALEAVEVLVDRGADLHGAAHVEVAAEYQRLSVMDDVHRPTPVPRVPSRVCPSIMPRTRMTREHGGLVAPRRAIFSAHRALRSSTWST